MTKQWNGAAPEDPFNAWVRAHPRLDSRTDHMVITDSDMWVHRYAIRHRGGVLRDVQYVMLVEWKTHGADLTPSQRDTLHIVNQLLRTERWRDQRVNGQFAPGHRQNTAPLKDVFSAWLKRRVQVISYGAHKLQLSGSTPDDSDRIVWDSTQITASQLVEVLRFDRNPDSLLPMEHRQHKKKVAAQLSFFPSTPVRLLPPGSRSASGENSQHQA